MGFLRWRRERTTAAAVVVVIVVVDDDAARRRVVVVVIVVVVDCPAHRENSDHRIALQRRCTEDAGLANIFPACQQQRNRTIYQVHQTLHGACRDHLIPKKS